MVTLWLKQDCFEWNMSLFLNGYEVNCPLWRLTQRPLLWLRQPLPPGRKYQAYICYNKYRLLSVLVELLPLNLVLCEICVHCFSIFFEYVVSLSSHKYLTCIQCSISSHGMSLIPTNSVKCSALHFRTEHTIYLEWNILHRMMQHSPLALQEPF